MLVKNFTWSTIYIIFGKFTVNFGYIQYKMLDRGLLEFIGPTGLTKIVKNLNKQIKPLF